MKASMAVFIQEGGDLNGTFFNRVIKNIIPRDIGKEVMERVPISTLKNERCSFGPWLMEERKEIFNL